MENSKEQVSVFDPGLSARLADTRRGGPRVSVRRCTQVTSRPRVRRSRSRCRARVPPRWDGRLRPAVTGSMATP